MKGIVKRFTVGLAVVAALFCIGTGTVFAENTLCPANAPQHIKDSEVCSEQEDPIAGPGGLINDVTVIVSIVAGIVAVVMMMYGGFQYISSGGDSNKAQEGRKILIWSTVGLVVIVLARSIILFVINRL